MNDLKIHALDEKKLTVHRYLIQSFQKFLAENLCLIAIEWPIVKHRPAPIIPPDK